MITHMSSENDQSMQVDKLEDAECSVAMTMGTSLCADFSQSR